MPLPVSPPATFAAMVAMTGGRVDPRLDLLLLRATVISPPFVPALLLIHPTPGGWAAAPAWTASFNPWLLVLALAGNAVVPWMISWE